MEQQVTIQRALILNEDGYSPVDVQLQGDRIVAIGTDLEAIGTVVDGRDKLLLPGFVNAHTHSSEMWQRGLIPPVPLELWIAELYDFTPNDPEKLYLSALGTAIETLLSGGTTVVDHLVTIPGREAESVAAAVRAYREIGIRAVVGPLIHDQALESGVPSGQSSLNASSGYSLTDPAATGGAATDHPAPDSSFTKEMLETMAALVEQFHRPHEGIHIMTAPTGMQLCSDRLFEGCVELSDRHHLCRHTHLLETQAQLKLAHEKYGCSAVRHLADLGFLSDRTSLAHAVWLDDNDISLLGETNSTVVHNPLSNLRLGSGIAPILKYRQAGVNVAFGCDGSASNDAQDMLEVIKIGSMLHNVTDLDYRHWITPQDAVKMAALGGAKGLGMGDRLGTLEVGKVADLVLYDLTSLSLLPRTDPLGLLVWGRPTQVVDHVWVSGRCVVANGKVVMVDEQAFRQALSDRSHWQTARHSETRMAIEAHYRQVMGLPN